MNPSRYDFFRQLTDNAKKALTKDNLTVSEILEIIDETALTGLERSIAILRYTKCKTFEEIADETGYNIRTICRKLPLTARRIVQNSLKPTSKSQSQV